MATNESLITIESVSPSSEVRRVSYAEFRRSVVNSAALCATLAGRHLTSVGVLAMVAAAVVLDGYNFFVVPTHIPEGGYHRNLTIPLSMPTPYFEYKAIIPPSEQKPQRTFSDGDYFIIANKLLTERGFSGNKLSFIDKIEQNGYKVLSKLLEDVVIIPLENTAFTANKDLPVTSLPIQSGESGFGKGIEMDTVNQNDLVLTRGMFVSRHEGKSTVYFMVRAKLQPLEKGQPKPDSPNIFGDNIVLPRFIVAAVGTSPQDMEFNLEGFTGPEQAFIARIAFPETLPTKSLASNF